MGIRAIASVASAVARRKKTHQVKIYNMIETALDQRIKNPGCTFHITLHSIWQERNDIHHGATPMVAGSVVLN
ncbi:hypothetical protein HID58_070956, partial [Brassica napus]